MAQDKENKKDEMVRISVFVSSEDLEKASYKTRKKLNKGWTVKTTDIIRDALKEYIKNN